MRDAWAQVLDWGEAYGKALVSAVKAAGEPWTYALSEEAGGLVEPIMLVARTVLGTRMPPWVRDYPLEYVEEELRGAASHRRAMPWLPCRLHAARAAVLGDSALAEQVCAAVEQQHQALANGPGKYFETWIAETPFTVRAALRGDRLAFHRHLEIQTHAHYRFAAVGSDASPADLCWPSSGREAGVLSIDFVAYLLLRLFPRLRPTVPGGLRSIPAFDIIDC